MSKYFLESIRTRFQSLITSLNDSINTERIRTANILVSDNPEQPDQDQPEVRQSFGHVITKKMCKALKALYSSLEPSTIIKAFNRCGMDMYNSTGVYRMKLDLSLADRVLEVIPTLKSFPEFSILEEDNKDKKYIFSRHNCLTPSSQLNEVLDGKVKMNIFTPDNKITTNFQKPIFKQPEVRNQITVSKMRQTFIDTIKENCAKFQIDPPNFESMSFYFETNWKRESGMDLKLYKHETAIPLTELKKKHILKT